MAQNGSTVVFLLKDGEVREHPRCIGGQGRKSGGESCRDCGVKKPVPVARWLKKLSRWAAGAQFLFEQAEKLTPAVKICVNQGWMGHSSKDAKDWLFDQLGLAVFTLVHAGHITPSVAAGLQRRFKQVVRRKAFFSPTYRGILQDNILDCARRLSIELWQDGERPDIMFRPGGEYYAYLHSLCNFLFETKKRVTLADLCEAIDTRYSDFSSQEKRLVFAFCLLREFSRRLNRHSGKSPGVSRPRQELILDFIRRTAISS